MDGIAFQSSSSAPRSKNGNSTTRKGGDDLLTVEAAVFDKDLAGGVATDHDAGKVDAGNVALERFGTHRGLVRLRIEGNPLPAQKVEVRMVARERKNLRGRQRARAITVLNPDF